MAVTPVRGVSISQVAPIALPLVLAWTLVGILTGYASAPFSAVSWCITAALYAAMAIPAGAFPTFALDVPLLSLGVAAIAFIEFGIYTR